MDELKAPALPGSDSNFQLAEHARYVYRAGVPAGVPSDRLKDADYWVHHARKLKAGFLIEAVAQDGKWFAELYVRKVDKDGAHCTMLRCVSLEEKAPAAAEFRVAFGGAHKWRVVRTSDNHVVHHGEPTEADAQRWLDEHLMTLA